MATKHSGWDVLEESVSILVALPLVDVDGYMCKYHLLHTNDGFQIVDMHDGTNPWCSQGKCASRRLLQHLNHGGIESFLQKDLSPLRIQTVNPHQIPTHSPGCQSDEMLEASEGM